MEQLEIICLNHFLGRCKNCAVDLDKTHHPNNYDCPGFKPLALTVYVIKNSKYEVQQDK